MSVSSMLTSPISRAEFLQMFQRCKPPPGWSSKIAVANSGGPDSTCLLFLMQRLLYDETMVGKGLPTSLVSLTVDHGLQASSSSMAAQCAKSAASLKVPHKKETIPWSEPPFPPRPTGSNDFENIARDARFHVLFNLMIQTGAPNVAFGHHADDQVETSLMRLAKGTTEVGAGGMRSCRRWGMGLGRSDEGELGWAGYQGMNKWIVRPLLEVSKDRILATCEENGLVYVTDATNFQPEITLRNAIRKMLDDGETGSESSEDASTTTPEINEQLSKIKEASESLQLAYYDITGGKEQLRGAVKALSTRVTDIDKEVDRHLSRRAVASPAGTFLLSSHNLSAIQDETIRAAMVMRILRYVSFQPWGSVRAEANRRRDSIQRIVECLWSTKPLSQQQAFLVAGGGVYWRPAVVSGGGDRLGRHRIKIPQGDFATMPKHDGDRLGWIASRQPPYSKRLRHNSDGTPQGDQLHLNLTDILSEARKRNDKLIEVLWDCRFLLRFNISRMPSEIGMSIAVGRSKVIVEPRTRWYWPQVMWSRPGRDDLNLAAVVDDHQSSGGLLKLAGGVRSDWINIEFIRTLDAT